MDHAAPPVPPTHQPAAAKRESKQPFALGESQAWALTETEDGIVLAIGGTTTLRFERGTWHATPAGRTLIAAGPGGTMRLRVDHARCRDGAGHYAELTLGGRALPGCLLDTGDRPYDGGG